MTRRIGCTVLALALAAVGCDETPMGTTTSELGDAPGVSSSMHISTPCTFTTAGSTMTLDGDCQTDQTILVPDGFTLDGDGHTITAVDPESGAFTGAVVSNAGSEMHVTDVTITSDGLANVCHSGANRLRGILLDGAAGSVKHVTVDGVNQGESGCQEGNAIEARNAPFDGTHPNTLKVTINHNHVSGYMKSGIIVNGDIDASIAHNRVESANLDEFTAANSVQVGFGASASVKKNHITGNDWDGPTDFAATAVLIFGAEDVPVQNNIIDGEGTDIGIFGLSSGTLNVMNNEISRSAEDASQCLPDDTHPSDSFRDSDDKVSNGVFTPCDPYGVGVWFFGNAGPSKIVRNDFDGWNVDAFGADVAQANDPSPSMP